VVDRPERGSHEGRRLERLGLDALGEGRLAMVVLAGGMATRMGSVVKGLVEAIPGATFLDARLAEREYWQRTSGAQLPMWLMTSHATDGPIREALGGQIDGERVDAFEQGASLRLTPDGCLFRGDGGLPSIHATGHGDLPEALAAAGLLDRFLAAGGRYLWIMNLDNLGAAVDPLVLGWHIDHGAPLTVEVVDKQEGDRGGIPVRLDDRPVVLENFRLPDEFDEDTVRVFNTNTFLADAAALRDLRMDWSWFRVEKTVDGRPAIQFERLVGELTSALESRLLRVPRLGAESRFLPAKSWDELDAHRAQIAARIEPMLAQVRDSS
jgi:UTP--glucose-1-phosphate uridylyltransferase